MLFKVELITTTTPAKVFVLCRSSLDLAEQNISLNGVRVIDYVDFVRGTFAKAFDMGNRRNVLSFDVTRAENFEGRPFRDAADALLFAMDQDALLPAISQARITVQGSITSGVRWLDNVAVQQTSLGRVVGLAHRYKFTLNGGAFSATQPAAS